MYVCFHNWQNMLVHVFLLSSVILVATAQDDFEVPEAYVEVFHPRGFRVSIPDVPGITLFAFHGKLNEPLNGREGGEYSRDITRKKDGRWSFYEPYTKLKRGDVLYYWLYVDYYDGKKKLGYVRDAQEFVVGNDFTHLNPNANKGNRPNEGNKPDKEKPPEPEPSTTTTTQSPIVVTRGPDVEEVDRCAIFSDTKVSGKHACKGQLIFEDHFNDLGDRWIKEVRLAGSPDYEFVTYINSPDNVATRGGNLYIKPTLAADKFGENFINDKINLGRNCTGIPGTADCDRKAESFQILPPIFSGKITTREKFNFVYGKVEIRAKLPKGNWVYPELFLNPKSPEYGLDYDSGQIRIAFSPGNEQLGKELMGGVVLGTSPEARSQMMRSATNELKRWSDDFHIYTVEWRKDSITCSVDGMAYGNIYAPSGDFSSIANQIKSDAGDRWHEGGPFAPFNKEMYLTIGVGVGGHNFPDNVVGGKPWKNLSPKNMLSFWQDKNNWFSTWNADAALVVDYARVWAL